MAAPCRSHSQLRLRLCQLRLEAAHLPLRIQQPLRTPAAADTRQGKGCVMVKRERGMQS